MIKYCYLIGVISILSISPSLLIGQTTPGNGPGDHSCAEHSAD
jgi:hypothetical protein